MANRFHLTHRQAVEVSWTLIILVLLSEGFCAFRCWSQHDVVTAWLVVAAWFREGFSVMLEKLGEAAVEVI